MASQTIQVKVTKGGSVSIQDTWILSQEGGIFYIPKKQPSENIVGNFSVKLPEKFDLWGSNAESRKTVTEMLKKAKQIAGIKKK
jgi:hypothetical protein